MRIPGALLGILLSAVLAGRVDAGPGRSSDSAAVRVTPVPAEMPDPCGLLSDSEVRAVQGYAPTQKLPSEQTGGSFRMAQCFYKTPEFASSVSVALGLPLPGDAQRSGPREYWRLRFHGQASAAAGEGRAGSPAPGAKKKEPPKPMPGLGEEAFWVGDAVTGALYVLKGETFLRLSAGGEPARKLERTRALAAHALKRLDARKTN